MNWATTIMEYSGAHENGRKTCARARTKGFEEGEVSNAQGFSENGFALSGIVPQNNSHTSCRRSQAYRCEATSIEGFIQQVAVSYVGRGYWFYSAGCVPENKDPREVDRKLIEKYRIGISKWTRARRKKLGLGNVQYIRFDRFFLLLACNGKHEFFLKEGCIRDVRRAPIRFAGYSISYRTGCDGQWHPSVRIDRLEFEWLKKWLFRLALTATFEVLVARFKGLRFEPYAPIRKQYFELLRGINKRRKLASLEPLPSCIVSTRRRIVAPFEKDFR